MRKLFATFLSALFVLLIAGNGEAQQLTANDPPLSVESQPGEYKLSVKTHLVNVTAIVHDRKGAVVKTLTKDDFIVTEDGKARPLRYFDIDNDLPLTLGLLVDTSGSQAAYAEEERDASHTFLKQMLTRPQDRAFLERFDYQATILHSLTSDVAALDRALALLVDTSDTPNTPGTKNTPVPKSKPAPKKGGGTLLWDATVATLRQIVSKEPGRRALIIMTDGEDSGSQATLQDAVNIALLYDVPIYSILYTEKGAGFLAPMSPALRQALHSTNAGPYGMEVLSQTTGGRAFAVSTMSIDSIFAAIEEDLRSQYRFSFTPITATAGSFHKLQVKTKDGHYQIRAREGYYNHP